jgi:hypothetical protein
MKRVCRVSLCLSIIAVCAGCEEQPVEPSEQFELFFNSAETCYQTGCEVDFLAKEDCTRAWEMQASMPQAKTRADEIAYFQARLLLDRAYQQALERRLGQSEYSRSICGQRVSPLQPL